VQQPLSHCRVHTGTRPRVGISCLEAKQRSNYFEDQTMTDQWSTTTSKKGRRKKGATHKQKVAAKQAELKRLERAKRRQEENVYNQRAANGRSPPKSPKERGQSLTNAQYRVMQYMQGLPDYYGVDEFLLRKIVSELNLNRAQQLDRPATKLEILDRILPEFQSKVPGKKKKAKKAKKSTNGQLSPSSPGTLSPYNALNRQSERGLNGHRDRQKSSRSSKSGKFKQFMAARPSPKVSETKSVGARLLDFVDVATLCTLMRIGAFHFVALDLRIMTMRQRWSAYTATKDIEYRLKQFNSTLKVESTLKLYELRRAQSIATRDCLNVVMANGLCLDHRFRGKNDSDFAVTMDLGKKGMVEAAEKMLSAKCKQLNVWSSNAILEDLHAAYLVEFAEFQAAERRRRGLMGSKPPVSATRKEDEGKRYLQHLDDLVVDRTVIGRDNVLSVHCCYSKVHRPALYEVHSYLWVFVEVKTPKMNLKPPPRPRRGRAPRVREERRQIMVWKGQCGVTKL